MTITTATQQFLDKFTNSSGVTNYARFTDAEGNRHEIHRASRSLRTAIPLANYVFSKKRAYDLDDIVTFGAISGYCWSVANHAQGTLESHWVVAGVHMDGKYYPVPDGHKSLIKEMTKIAPLANWRWFRGGGEY